MFPTWPTCLALLVSGLQLLLHEILYSGEKLGGRVYRRCVIQALWSRCKNCLADPLHCFLKRPLQHSVKWTQVVVDFVIFSVHAIKLEGKINPASEWVLYRNCIATSVHNLTLWGVNILYLLEII